MEKITFDAPETSSTDVIDDNVRQLEALFPEAFAEGKIDFGVLRQLLGDEVDEHNEKYGLNWHGKRMARQLALTPSTGTLRPCPEESLNWSTSQNLMIEGENLEVLKLLQKSYAGKVKLIYIDPPYNTGKDFVFPDDYRDNIRNYLELTGQIDDENRKLSSNSEASGRFHTVWLNMMYPRLKLARNLLMSSGVLLVSINDVEVASLRFILNDIFGEENFLCQFIWNNEGNVDQQSKIKGVHEYIVAYARTVEELARPTVIDPNIEETSKLFNDQIENSITKTGTANPPSDIRLPQGFPATFDEGIIPPRTDQWPHILDEIVVERSQLQHPVTIRSGWSSKNLFELFIANGCVPIQDNSGKETWFALTHTGAIYGYKRRSELQGHVLSVIRNVGTTKQNSSMLSKWGIKFSYPKPLLLLKYLVQIFTDSTSNDFVLDFFAGSGTLGHAVMEANSNDGGNRRFALVQYPEEFEARPNESLFDLCKRRIECATEHSSQYESGTHVPNGFRTFRLDTSNILPWLPDRENLSDTLMTNINHLRLDRTTEDILYELLLKLGIDLCVPIEKQMISGKLVHSVGAGTLIACLDESVVWEEVEPLALGIAEWYTKMAPAGESIVVFRDSAFEDDIVKTNCTAILQQYGLTNIRSL
ncbi:MAG: site-specific DNA-methyltransferase [Caldilineaceae bacterium]|nr:site-specific DNA-methyltransferase [Caldilineaceae bacterium]